MLDNSDVGGENLISGPFVCVYYRAVDLPCPKISLGVNPYRPSPVLEKSRVHYLNYSHETLALAVKTLISRLFVGARTRAVVEALAVA